MELAKPHYTIKLQQEWQEQQQEEQEQATTAQQQGPPAVSTAAASDGVVDDDAAATIRITIPGTRKVGWSRGNTGTIDYSLLPAADLHSCVEQAVLV